MKLGADLPDPVKNVAQRVAVGGWGRSTSRWRAVPNLLICGGQRCGTTSMYRALSQHPGVSKPVLHKGVHYFDTHYDRGLSWYRSYFPLESTVAKAGTLVGAEPVVLESSPYYGFHPQAVDRIAADLPGVKLVVLIRDPVERAYSAHAHEIARGFETETFERALDLEPERLAGEVERILADPRYVSHAHQHQAYVARGQYVDLLQRLESVVGADRLHVVDSHRFFTDPEPVYAEVLRYLDLPDTGGVKFERHNARPRPVIDDHVEKRLTEHFRPYDEQLCEHLGWRPSWCE